MKIATAVTCATFCLALPLINSCGSAVGLGSDTAGNYASTKIQSSDLALIRSTTSAVFQESGFRLMPSARYSLSFQKTGNRSAQAAWGQNFNSNPVMIEPEVQIDTRGQETILTCNVFIVQQSNAFGSNVKQPHLIGKAGYERMLSTIRKRVEATERSAR